MMFENIHKDEIVPDSIKLSETSLSLTYKIKGSLGTDHPDEFVRYLNENTDKTYFIEEDSESFKKTDMKDSCYKIKSTEPYCFGEFMVVIKPEQIPLWDKNTKISIQKFTGNYELIEKYAQELTEFVNSKSR